ncbi:putative bifunctional diguanylate cyclase/phosphodiesterase [Tepidiphilus baoligensis]|uniref:EAL domain-containing protein n=1 Tax=Tepidiphilus baoligensis TaxID=2698687 RepID=A0ABX1QJR4_9PROT|nr:EAL domain-containing protein [Tepidiphilus baoligensis]NMH15585.1 EAL domain-containing protein [Tepidiphilus baoligensis]
MSRLAALPLALRVTLPLLALILGVMAGESWLRWRTLQAHTLLEVQERLLGRATTLAWTAERHWQARPDEVRALIRFLSSTPGHLATVLTDEHGSVLAAHRHDWEGRPVAEILPSFALPPPSSPGTKHWRTEHETLLLAVAWRPHDAPSARLDQPPGWLLLIHDPRAELAGRLREHRRAFALNAALSLGIVLLLGGLIHWRGGRPLQALTRALSATATSNSYRPPDLRGAVPELRALGLALEQAMSSLFSHQERLRLLEKAIEVSPAQVMITDTQPSIVYVNRAFTEVTGYRCDEVEGKNPRILQSGKTPRETYLDLWTRLQAGRPWSGEFINRRKDGKEYVEFAHIAPVFDDEGSITHYVAVKHDITEQQRLSERLSYLLTHDPLTGLANRQLLLERIALRLVQGQHSHESFALIVFDLDHFAAINDRLGSHAGDAILRRIAHTLVHRLTNCDTIARLESDEFAVLTDAQPSASKATELAWELARTIAHDLDRSTQPLLAERFPPTRLTVSTGIVVFPDEFGNAQEVLAAAALALQHALQSQEPGAIRLYESLSADLLARRGTIEQGLRAALAGSDEHCLDVHYQGQFDAARRLIGAEALLRFTHARLGRVPPSECIAVAERSELIFLLGAWILRRALSDAMRWRQELRWDGTLSVNVSAHGLRDPDFVDRVLALLAETGYPAQRLVLELKETTALSYLGGLERVMRRLAEAGVRWSIDDFGTGIFGPHYLARLPLSEIKIDQSFIQRAPHETRTQRLIHAMVEMAGAFSFRTIAEGVEDDDQLLALRAYPELVLQGWGLARPEPAEAFAQRLAQAAGQR